MTMPICFLTWWPQLTLENYRQITFLNTSPYKNCLIMVSFHSKRTSSVGKKAWYHSRCLTINTLYLCLSWHTLSRMYGCYKMYWIKQIKFSNFWHSFIWFLVIFILTLFLLNSWSQMFLLILLLTVQGEEGYKLHHDQEAQVPEYEVASC